LVLFLISVSSIKPAEATRYMLVHAALIAVAAPFANLPLLSILARAAAVLPFSAILSLLTAFAGDTSSAALLLAKSYLSACAAVLTLGVLGVPRFTRALASLGAPEPLVAVLQLIYRYLLLLVSEAQSMLIAARVRGGGNNRKLAFSAATGSATTLFSRAYDRANRIHQAMLSRSYHGELQTVHREQFRFGDTLFLTFVLVLLTLRFYIWR
ncbi:MAG TPA: CbiQ family ECF transporter T component, partial [Bryobacteraceae bacterium]|nr:CbiQ family ECF transporter T component [Bryobacteraceae bacterium]